MSHRLALPIWLLLLTSLLPGPAAGAPRPVALAEYQAQLRQGLALLERAEQQLASRRQAEAGASIQASREQLSGLWRVDTPHGPVDADLTALADLLARAAAQPPGPLPRAIALARDHLAAAEALARVSPVAVADARQTLDAALREGAARTLLQRLQAWWSEFLGRRAMAPVAQASETTYYVGGVLALGALGFLGFQLYRTLAQQSAPADAALQAARAGRPDRPLTPAELREEARRLSREGDYLAAIRAAHLALLQHLDSLKLIRYVPAQTNREHEWQLRRRYPSLARGFRSLNDLVDDRLYSGHGATADDFTRVDALVDQLWREGDAASKSAEAPTGA